jgi:hydroxyacylglutathione hydrolase
MFFLQLKKSGDNFSYVLADETAKEAAVVDPSRNGGEIARLLNERGLRLKYVLLTHHHPDHVGDTEELRRNMGGKVVAHRSSSVDCDLRVDDGDELELGSLHMRVLHTPGHTPDSVCFLAEGKLMTGDTLFVGECGRTDLPDGDPSAMFDSLLVKLSSLGDEVEVYPGHDYGPRPSSTIGEEKRTNYTLIRRTRHEFIRFMKEP